MSTIRRLATTLLACLALLSWCAPASASSWTQPNVTALPGSLVKGTGAWLELPWTVVWKVEHLAVGSGPAAIQRLADGTILIVSRGDARVYEVGPTGVKNAWEYAGTAPAYAARLSDGNTLVVEPTEPAVLAVDHATPPVEQWRVDFPVGTVPVHAAMLPAVNSLGNAGLLVCDRNGRVLAVNTDGTVVWEYASASDGWPVHAEYLPNGNVLISYDVNRTRLTDSGVVEGNLVREVRPDKTTAWQYGTNGTMGSGANQLMYPVWAERLADGTTVITDAGNNRIIRVNAAGAIVWQYSAASLLGLTDIGVSAPGAAIVTPQNSILIADTNNDRLIELGRALSGTVTSGQIDCGLAGVRKKFSSVNAKVDVPAGTAFTVSYSIDGGSWKPLSGAALPANTYGKFIRYRVTLTSTQRSVTPRLTGVSIGYAAAPTSGSSSGTGTGTGGTGTTRRWTGYSPGFGTGTGTITSGSKQGGSGFTADGSVSVSTGLDGALSSQRGWAMASIGSTTVLGGPPGSAGAPASSIGGLIMLGALYGAGAVSVPLGHLLARLTGRTPLAT